MTKEQINRLIHSYVEPERCWHKHDLKNVDECLCCKKAFQDVNGEPYDCEQDNPDYSLPDHWTRLKDKLFSDTLEMYEIFEYYAGNTWAATGTTQFLLPWLFSDFSRFAALFAEFLCLDETREEFGIIKCKNTSKVECHDCTKCDGNGLVLTPWARYAGEIDVWNFIKENNIPCNDYEATR